MQLSLRLEVTQLFASLQITDGINIHIEMIELIASAAENLGSIWGYYVKCKKDWEMLYKPQLNSISLLTSKQRPPQIWQ